MFGPGSDGDTTVEVDATLDNVGDGEMDVESISYSFVPSGLSPRTDDLPGTIRAGGSGDATIDVTVEDSLSEGTHSFTAEVQDSLGNSQSFQVTVEVIKPPAVGVSEDPVAVGEVLVGSDASRQFTITEEGGYDSISGIDVSSLGLTKEGQISFPDENSVSVSRSGSTQTTVEVSLNDGVEQGKEVEWQQEIAPDDPDGFVARPTFTATVIYPPYFDNVTVADEEIQFDEPRDEVDMFEQDVDVEITNGGDLEMNILDVSPTVTDSDVTATVVDQPNTIGPRSTETATVRVSADSSAAEQTVNLSVDVTADEPGTTTANGTVGVVHNADLLVTSTEFEMGELVLLEELSRSTTIAERLGYEDVESFSVERVSGPDKEWLTVTQQPDTLAAGESTQFIFAVEFDTSAELFTQQTWVFELDGENVEREEIRITATPQPVDFQETVETLENAGDGATGERATVTTEMADALTTLETQLQDDNTEANPDDITVLTTAANSGALFVAATQKAETAIENGNHEAAQQHLVNASANHNALTRYESEVSDDELRGQVRSARQAGDTVLADLLEQQRAHYEEQLETGELTTLEKAQVMRDLARLAELSGNEQEAAGLRKNSSALFEEYSTLVEDANSDLIEAREQREELDRQLFSRPFGQRVFFIGSFSTFNAESEEVLTTYDSAIEKFEEAGATDRAADARAERESLANSYGTSRLLSIALGAVLALLLLGFVAWEIRGLYRYRQDTEEAVSGDFLLPWAENQ